MVVMSMNSGKGFGGGEATRDPAPTAIDPNDPKGKQQAIHKAESFAEYLAKRAVSGSAGESTRDPAVPAPAAGMSAADRLLAAGKASAAARPAVRKQFFPTAYSAWMAKLDPQVTSQAAAHAWRLLQSAQPADTGVHGGKGFGGGEATRDPAPTEIDPNDPKGKQQAIHKAESFAEYLAKRRL